jgi:hypothetical protein
VFNPQSPRLLCLPPDTTRPAFTPCVRLPPLALCQVGDRLVIASSSFFAEEVDEADIVGLDTSVNGVTIVTLSQPLQYTHLGEVVSVPGETKVLDMRAEVTVLTRNVLITVRAPGRVRRRQHGLDTGSWHGCPAVRVRRQWPLCCVCTLTVWWVMT